MEGWAEGWGREGCGMQHKCAALVAAEITLQVASCVVEFINAEIIHCTIEWACPDCHTKPFWLTDCGSCVWACVICVCVCVYGTHTPTHPPRLGKRQSGRWCAIISMQCANKMHQFEETIYLLLIRHVWQAKARQLTQLTYKQIYTCTYVQCVHAFIYSVFNMKHTISPRSLCCIWSI